MKRGRGRPKTLEKGKLVGVKLNLRAAMIHEQIKGHIDFSKFVSDRVVEFFEKDGGKKYKKARIGEIYVQIKTLQEEQKKLAEEVNR